MEQSFDELLASLLESYDAEEDKNVDSFIKKKVKELGLTKESIDRLEKTNEWIEAFDKNARDLNNAKEDDECSRQSWVQSKINVILDGRNDEEKTTVANTLLKSGEEEITKILSKEE
jgi:hypothetical protein